MEDHSPPADASKCHVPYAENENIWHSWTFIGLVSIILFLLTQLRLQTRRPVQVNRKAHDSNAEPLLAFLTAKPAHLLMFLNVPMGSYELASNPVSLVSHLISGDTACADSADVTKVSSFV